MDTLYCSICGPVQSDNGLCPTHGTPLTQSAPSVHYTPPPPPPEDEDEEDDEDANTVTASVLTAPIPMPSVMSQPLPPMPVEHSSMSARQAAETGQGLGFPVRPKLNPFLPMHPVEEPVLVARSWTGRQLSVDQRKLSRKRKIAQDLPEWNPMPPGELTVVRVTAHDAGKA